jgi:uncharacterized membrane protein YheB (UPF0754 family)
MHLLQVALYLPIAGAAIGLITKWAAIKLVFWPPEFVGVGPIGWQGIVQRRSPKFAAGVADTVGGDAIDVNDLVGRLDGGALAEAVEPHVRRSAYDLARAALAAAGETEPNPEDIASLANRLPGYIESGAKQLVSDLSPVIAETLDVRELVIDMLSGPNADRLARLTRSVAAHELRWVIWYGGIGLRHRRGGHRRGGGLRALVDAPGDRGDRRADQQLPRHPDDLPAVGAEALPGPVLLSGPLPSSTS